MNPAPIPTNGYRLQSDDSSYAAERARFESWAGMDEATKARAVRRLLSRASLLQERGLREIHPQADAREIFLRAAALRLGSENVRRWTGFDADRV
ncbi:MAG: hypothetical protein NTY35_12275 [Planctomycetota bacterium]|nr:hypothetical protein [Planctomycetota bacterium]